MSLSQFVQRSSQRRTSTQQGSQAGPSQPPPPIGHFAASRNLGKARADQPSSPSDSRESTPSLDAVSRDFPNDRRLNAGLCFTIDWDNLYLGSKRLRPEKVGYRVKHSSQLRGSRRESRVWRFGADLVYQKDDGSKVKVWLCERCHTRGDKSAAKSINGYNHIVTHLLQKHQITVNPTEGDVALLPDGPRPLNPFEAASLVGGVAGAGRVVSHSRWQEGALQTALVDLVILQDHSFLNASSDELRALISWNRLDLLAALPSSHSTISSYVNQGLVARKTTIQTVLLSSRSKITLSFDIWTSPNHLSFLGVVAHFIDSTYHHQDLLIGFRNLFADHTGENQGSQIATILHEYNITSKFHCFVADNAYNNDDRTITTLATILNKPLGPEHRVRCAGHMIQLVVKAVIYGKGVSQFEKDLAQAAPQEQFELYQKHGVVGKLHNFVNAVLSSHKRREAFTAFQKDIHERDNLWLGGTLNLVQDGGIRWHSTYLMLLRCLELKDPIEKFIWQNNRLPGKDKPSNAALLELITADDWHEAERLCNFLKRFYEMTKRLEGNGQYGSLWMTIPNLQYLYDRLLEMKDELYGESNDSYLKSGVSFGLEKLLTYWEKVVIEPPTSYYAIATILNPKFRIGWFHDHWRHHPHWVRKVKKSMETIFQQYVDAEEEPELPYEPTSHTRRKLPGGEYHDDDYEKLCSVDLSLLTGEKSYKKQRRATELQQYNDSLREDLTLANETDPLFTNPLAWWLADGRHTYPTLFQIALDFLCIPCTSCDCERAFSGGKQTVTYCRNSLGGKTIEALQLQKNWLKRRVVDSEMTALGDHIRKLREVTS